ncbi:MAG: glycosyltransferase N-terminal domain-containing protein [Pseudomonadota bacterium]
MTEQHASAKKTKRTPTARLNKLGGRAVAALINAVDSTSKPQFEPPDLISWASQHHPFIAACWHGQFMMLVAMNKRAGLPTSAMVARHGDAELIGEAMRQFDVELIRGAGAGHRKKDRGGSAALRGSARALSEGNGRTIVMTADVPPGPARRAGEGIIKLAQMTGRPIIPLAAASSQYWSLRTWSRLTFNLPFSRMGYLAGQPIFVARNSSPEQIEEARLALEVSLNEMTQRAYASVGRDAAAITPNHAREAQAPPPPKSLTLRAYGHVTAGLSPLAPLLLRHREQRGKEIAERRRERFGEASKQRPDGSLAWVHAASVGETNAITPILHELRARRPDINILLTTGTTTSARLAEARLADLVTHQFLPLDVTRYLRRFLDYWQPDVLMLTESEIWPNLILQTAQRGCPIALLNGRLSRRSFGRWRKRLATAEALFGRLDLVLAQDEVMAYRFKEVGVRNVSPIGNLKYDAAPPPINLEALGKLQAMIGERPVWLAFSTHHPEEADIARAHRLARAAHPDLLTIIMPRHPDRGIEIGESLKMDGLQIAQRSAHEAISEATEIYVADTLGETGTFLALADFAFVGGSLVAHGGHNPIEAIKHDCAAITGPHVHNFAEVYRLLERANGVVTVSDAQELAGTVQRLLTDADEWQRVTSRASGVVDNEAGALARALHHLDALLPLAKTSGAYGTSGDGQTDAPASTALADTTDVAGAPDETSQSGTLKTGPAGLERAS